MIYKYKAKSLVEVGLDWIDFFEKQVFKLIKQKEASSDELIKLEISEIANFCKLKIHAFLNPNKETKPIEATFKFDILKWLDEGCKSRLCEYKFPFDEEKLIFEYTEDQIKIRNDAFRRYGTDVNALSKIITRVSNLESQFRKVRYSNDKYLRDIYRKIGEDFVRYTLAN